MALLSSAKEVIKEILKLKGDIQRQVIVLLYLWWSERCAVREGETPRRYLHLAQLVRSYADEYSSLNQLNPVTIVPRQREIWKRPPTGYIKANCDGAFSPESCSGGWGFVLCDQEGRVISSGYGKLEMVLEPLQAEIIACLQALQRAAELACRD